LNWFHNAFKLLVTGAGCNGKTEYWGRFILSEPATVKFIFDHEGEFSQRFGIPRITEIADLERAIGTGWVCFDPVPSFGGNLDAAFAFFSEWVLAVSKEFDGRKLFGCDEIQEFMSTAKVCPEFAILWRTGRRYEIDFAVISSAPNAIHNVVRNNFTEIATFAHLDENALKFLIDNGITEESIRSLNQFEYIAWTKQPRAMERGKLEFRHA